MVLLKSLKWLFRPAHRRFAIGSLQIFCTTALFFEYVAAPRGMAGPSMMPTFSNAFQLVLEDRLSVRLSPHNVKRGDLVTFLSVYDPKKSVCKRVIGLPGDIICVFPEKAIAIASVSSSSSDDEVNQVEHIVVPRGHVWLSGDNLSNSRDSSEFGPIPMGLIQGKIVAKIWPSPMWLKSPVNLI